MTFQIIYKSFVYINQEYYIFEFIHHQTILNKHLFGTTKTYTMETNAK